MNPRLKRRCLVSSLVVHGLLLTLIFLAPGFQKSRPDLLGMPRPLELVPGELIDAALGMAPSPEPVPVEAVIPPPEEPVRQEPVVEPPPRVPKAKPKPEVAVVIPELERPTVATPPKAKPVEKKPAPPVIKKAPPVEKAPPRLDFSKAKAVPDTAKKAASKAPTTPEDTSRQRMAALAQQLALRTGDLERSASGAVNVQLSGAGGGGGGGGSANALHVRNAYDAAWVGVTDAGATAEVEVVLRGDGTVVSARVVRKSGIAALDRSVEAALKKVKQIRPFETFAREEQVTYIIDFNQRSRRSF
jgi:TonB family protein